MRPSAIVFAPDGVLHLPARPDQPYPDTSAALAALRNVGILTAVLSPRAGVYPAADVVCERSFARDGLELVIDMLGLSADEVLCVGARLDPDLYAAAAAGTHTALVDRTGRHAHSFRDLIHLIDTLRVPRAGRTAAAI